MAEEKNNFVDLLEPGTEPSISNTFLQVKTHRDGFTGIYQGKYSYLVVENGGEYVVYPVDLSNQDECLVFKNSPIIYTDDNNVHFVVSTLKETFQFPRTQTEDIGKLNKEQAVLAAFKAFAQSRFEFEDFHILIDDVNGDPFSVNDASQFNFVDEKGQSFEEVFLVEDRFPINVQGMKFKNETEEVNQNDKLQLHVEFTPRTATNQRVNFKSNRRHVVEVDENGLVTAVAEGKATVEAISAEGHYRAYVDITVKPSAENQAGVEPEEPSDVNVEPSEDNADVSANE